MNGDLIRLSDGGATLELGCFTLRKVGLVVRGTPSRAEWEHCGIVLRRIEGAVQWWIGDWLNYGEKAYGEKYIEAVDATGLDQGTLQNYAYVAANVKFSLRSENLPYSLHKEVASLTPPQQRQILTRAETDHLTVRGVRDLVRSTVHFAKVAAIERGTLPTGVYDIVAADPPWQYENSGFEQSAAAHYPTLPVEAIIDFPKTDPTFPKFADPCVLFLWVTSPLVPAGMRVVEGWGFQYKACLAWVKDRAPGVGWWLQTRHELLLVGTRGAITPLEKVDSVIEAAITEHSSKPSEAYARINRMFPGFRRVECFARTPRSGWQVWGNEV